MEQKYTSEELYKKWNNQYIIYFKMLWDMSKKKCIYFVKIFRVFYRYWSKELRQSNSGKERRWSQSQVKVQICHVFFALNMCLKFLNFYSHFVPFSIRLVLVIMQIDLFSISKEKKSIRNAFLIKSERSGILCFK